MSFGWNFSTVTRAAFESYFAGPHPERLAEFREALLWDEGAFAEEDAEAVAAHLAAYGLDYAQSDGRMGRLLDQSLPMLLSQEGLGPQVQIAPVSPDFVNPSAIGSLIRAASAAGLSIRLLPVLKAGRRYSTGVPCIDCNYCYLSIEEASELCAELSAILRSTTEWGRETWMPELVQECLLGPLAQAQPGQDILGVLG